jgi:LCP family protein required for cell wall assembly
MAIRRRSRNGSKPNPYLEKRGRGKSARLSSSPARKASVNAQGTGSKLGGTLHRPHAASKRTKRKPSGASRRPARKRPNNQFDLRRLHSRLLRVLVVICAMAIVFLVAAHAYGASVTGKLRSGLPEGVDDALASAATPDSPYYLLVLGKGQDRPQTDGRAGAQAQDEVLECIMLARVDVPGERVTVVSIPVNTYVDLGDDRGFAMLGSTYAGDGPASTVRLVSQLAGVQIGHYLEMDSEALQTLVDAVDGIPVDVSQRISDPEVGAPTIESGRQVLTGEQAVVYCRAKNVFANGDISRMAHQREVFSALLDKLIGKRGIGRLSLEDAYATSITSDMDSRTFSKTVKGLHGLDVTQDLYSAAVPTTAQTVDQMTYAVVDGNAWQAMMERVGAGERPTESTDIQAQADAASAGSYTVDIQNGAGVSGMVPQASERITAAGFKVGETGNAPSFNYRTTLIIYRDAPHEAAANAVAAAIGGGTLKLEDGTHTYSGDILLIIGQDWIPN